MSQDERNPIAAREVVFRLPGMDDVLVERDIVYTAGSGDALTFDLYLPGDGGAAAGPYPVVILVGGFPGLGVRRILGCPHKEVGAVVSWCLLFAASGIAAVAYENRQPAEDLQALLDFLRREGAARGMDTSRLGLWATSGNAPLALGALTEDGGFACAALGYPYTLDLDASTAVAEAAKSWGFVNGGAGKTVADLPAEIPLLVVRAGRDQFAGLNDALDRFVSAALRRNLPLTCVNHASAPHAFDMELDDEASRRAIRQILAFFASHLLAPR